jgi:glutathione S-transferase
MSAAEGTFMIHGLAVHYARWRMPEPAKSDGKTLAELEKGLAKNVQGDLDWLESELTEGDGDPKEFLVGDELTVADIMMHFSVQFILCAEARYRRKELAGGGALDGRLGGVGGVSEGC